MLATMPTTASGRFRVMFVVLASVEIVGLLLRFAGAVIEPVRFGGFAI